LIVGLRREKFKNYRRRIKRIQQKRQIAWENHYEEFQDEDEEQEAVEESNASQS